MCCALAEAKKAGESGEVPVGCVIVHDNEIVASAGNSCIKDNSPLRHAEVNAIEIACKKTKNFRPTLSYEIWIIARRKKNKIKINS